MLLTHTQNGLLIILGLLYTMIGIACYKRFRVKRRWYVTKHPTKEKAKLRKMVVLDEYEDKLTS